MFPVILRNTLIVHLALSLIYTWVILTDHSSLQPSFLPIIFFVPVFGLLSAIIADLTEHFKEKMRDPGEIETVKLEKDIYWKTIRKQAQSENIVPLEEALIINDRHTRKDLVLEMLLDDPMKNIDILMLARENNDVDTAHYANTTIAKIQRDFQLQVQKLAAAYKSDPENSKTLDTYIRTLDQFIDSGLSEAYLLHRQRMILDGLIDAKIKMDGWTRSVLQMKIKNALALNHIGAAIESNQIMHENFPQDEQTWLNELQICIAAHDAMRLNETVEKINNMDINWSPDGKEKISLWVEVESL